MTPAVENHKENSYLSVGIDIGTSTTHLVFSNIQITNNNQTTRICAPQIKSREIIYRSNIYKTPLNDDNSIDASKVATIIFNEYQNAGIIKESVNTGALIITGESARLRNSEEVAHEISSLAGNFVVASAGPELESILSGRGSGAAYYSQINNKTICNIDIGGGTTNYSIFSNGNCLDTACLGIGAKFISFKADKTIAKFTESGEIFLDGIAKLELLKSTDKPDNALLSLLANLCAELIVRTASENSIPQLAERLMQTNNLENNSQIDEYWLSGGVSELINQKYNKAKNNLPFLDMGLYLAEALIESFKSHNLNYKIAESGIRATVIGAGTHSFQISGNTICLGKLGKTQLPLKNIPIIHPFKNWSVHNPSPHEIVQKFKSFCSKLSPNEKESIKCISLTHLLEPEYQELKTWAIGISKAYQETGSKSPLILILSNDLAMALGQLINQINPNIELLVIDGIDITYGDFLDIGENLKDQTYLPVCLKTLIFQN